MTDPPLPIHKMEERHWGLTKSIADSNAEAARVCLDRHHQSPTLFQLERNESRSGAIARWQPTDERTRSARANRNDTTEYGAYACALAAVELVDGLFAVRRADTPTGVDYFVAPPGTSPKDLEKELRLEISGVDHGPEVKVARRLKEKLRQAMSGKSNKPAMAVVVGFRVRLICLTEVVEPDVLD